MDDVAQNRIPYEEHPLFERPADDKATVWRYMTFTKFVSLLNFNALYFPRLDRLGDEFEGMLPEKTYDRMSEWLRPAYEDVKNNTLVSCWTLQERESPALWRMYVGNNEGIVVRSTFARLRNSFWAKGIFQEASILIGKMKYIDFNTDCLLNESDTAPNALITIVHKRNCFEYERELRVVVHGLGTNILNTMIRQTAGMYVPADLKNLILGICVAPTSEKWFLDLVTLLVGNCGLPQSLVARSGLDDRPASWTD